MIHSSNHTIELGELHAKSALAEPALDELVLHDVGICPSKIEARTAVLRLHARRECSPLAQVNPSCCGMTVMEAAFHCWVSYGLFQAAQTSSMSAATVVSTVIFIVSPPGVLNS